MNIVRAILACLMVLLAGWQFAPSGTEGQPVPQAAAPEPIPNGPTAAAAAKAEPATTTLGTGAAAPVQRTPLRPQFGGSTTNFLAPEGGLVPFSWRNELKVRDRLSALTHDDLMITNLACTQARCALTLEAASREAHRTFLEKGVTLVGRIGAVTSVPTGDGRFAVQVRALL
jgi:hypothetical protein